MARDVIAPPVMNTQQMLTALYNLAVHIHDLDRAAEDKARAGLSPAPVSCHDDGVKNYQPS